MKLLVCVMNNYYANDIEKIVKEKGYRLTKLSSTGGFLKKGSTTFLFGVEDKDVSVLKEILKQSCLSIEKTKGKYEGVEGRFTTFLLDNVENMYA
ncbi:MAG: cyclic-di-AMP receptor [Bacillaceae bacterium]|nr:cyclic-di-AMP receptor [Bacillaceae bacterium]